MRSTSSSSILSRGPWRLLRRVLPVAFATALTLSFGTADAWAKGNVPSPAAPSQAEREASARTRAEVQAAVPFAIDDDLYEYAQREAKTRGLEDFHGGDVVIIGGTGLVIVLLIIIILLIL
jgi:hypothetical protein